MPVRQVDRSEGITNGYPHRAAETRSPVRIAEIQRARMIEATGHAAKEVGAGNLTVADIVAQAGVSRRTFYEIFEGCEDCLLAAFEDGVDRMAERATAAWHTEGSWRQRMRSGLMALLRFVDEEPQVGRLVVVEALGAGPRVLARRQLTIARLIAVVDEARAQSTAAEAAPPLTGEAVVGGVASVLYTRLLEEDRGSLAELLNPLMSMIVMPYFGVAAARRELSRPALPKSRPVRRPAESPLRELGIRVTYRTARALTAVAAHPGSSNRQIAGACGIADQGQVSKLLGRLERLGLVENAEIGPSTRGAPNAWRLTERGEAVCHALAAQSRG